MLPLIKLLCGVLLLSAVAHISFSEPFDCWYCDSVFGPPCTDNTTMNTTQCDNSTAACYHVTEADQIRIQSRYCVSLQIVAQTNELGKCRIIDGKTFQEYIDNWTRRRKRETKGKAHGRLVALPGENYKVCACNTPLCLGEDQPLATGPWPIPTTERTYENKKPGPASKPNGGGGSQGGSSNSERVSVSTCSFNLMLGSSSVAVLARRRIHGF